ncbi:MAG: hypothetical protein LBU13_00170 [Synergistaceae bacterium]|jgi:hypothetical protein|nr:hypothetical protein [Synergistaceae bacterium]
MSEMGISFSFGASAGRERGFANRLKLIAPLCAEAASWIKDGAFRDESGFGWYNLTEQDP